MYINFVSECFGDPSFIAFSRPGDATFFHSPFGEQNRLTTLFLGERLGYLPSGKLT